MWERLIFWESVREGIQGERWETWGLAAVALVYQGGDRDL